jgi:hypothetical protein
MIKLLSIFLLPLFLLTSENEYVKVTGPSEPIKVTVDKESTAEIYLKPVEGIHINLEPPIKIELLSSKGVTQIKEEKKATPQKTDDKLKTVEKKDGEYFDPSKPVLVKFKVGKDIGSGKTEIKAKVTYFYCSDKEGWCSQGRDEVIIPVVVSK